MIAHAARSEADSRAAATASELTQLKGTLEESQANIMQQSTSASVAEADLQKQLQVQQLNCATHDQLLFPQVWKELLVAC